MHASSHDSESGTHIYFFWPNLGVIQNLTIKDGLLKKKHVAISYHKTTEATAAGITHPIKILGTHNYPACLTNSSAEKTVDGLTSGCMSG
jgi:hypothetical protein